MTAPRPVTGARSENGFRLDGRVLVLGYGNPARLDDGLGPAFCEALVADGWDAPEYRTVQTAMQLHIEHAAEVAGYDVVVFVDATLPGPGSFVFEVVQPGARHAEFTTHSASPAGILGLARGLFGSEVRGYTLGIRGLEFGEFGEYLGGEARRNLDAALQFFHGLPARAEAPVRRAAAAEMIHG
ncbi:MAG: hydrogenase maturation protease [Gemmatimonadetes bacterium]|nr:hydrogenase maturation protease [Gemmatimonadota bacterium]